MTKLEKQYAKMTPAQRKKLEKMMGGKSNGKRK